LQQERLLMLAANNAPLAPSANLQGDDRSRAEAVAAFAAERYADVLSAWVGDAASPMEQLLLADAAGRAGTPEQVRPLLGQIREDWPADARFVAAQTAARHDAPDVAADHLREGFKALRGQIWARPQAVHAALSLVGPLMAAKPDQAQLFLDVLRDPFAGGLAEGGRLNALLAIAPHLPALRQAEVARLFEPYPPWTREFLELRLNAYRQAGDSRAEQAQRDLREYLRHADLRLDEPGPTAR
jgi:hypothetical protein